MRADLQEAGAFDARGRADAFNRRHVPQRAKRSVESILVLPTSL
ncbi:MAG TPA: hypothetical protein VFD58_18110 [Blastocatellia bacterium]|nr:hypothetical protein [Blastocatellia bacterium]